MVLAHGYKVPPSPLLDKSRMGTAASFPTGSIRTAVLRNHLAKYHGGHSYGCLQVMLSDGLRKEIVDWSLDNIPDFHLGKGGREFRTHVTVKYGLTSSDEETIQGVKAIIVGNGKWMPQRGQQRNQPRQQTQSLPPEVDDTSDIPF